MAKDKQVDTESDEDKGRAKPKKNKNSDGDKAKKKSKKSAEDKAKPKKNKKLKKRERRAAAVRAVATRLKANQARANRPKTTKAADAEPEEQLSLQPAKPVPAPPEDKPTSRRPTALPDQLAQALRVGPGFSLAAVDPNSIPAFVGDRNAAADQMAAVTEELADLQERLYAHGKTGGSRSVLLVVQGMDTAGKGGIMRHVVGSMDPQGVKLTAFKAPTPEEKKRGYLWRIRQALPAPGQVGVFDRSHYEDVLPVRVLNLAPRSVWGRRYSGINTFESQEVNRGMSIVKVMLHISKEEQGRRLLERIDRPDKHWKHNSGDIDNRQLWDEYMAAYQDLLTKCSTPAAPWYVVPADKKWYARLAVQQLVLKALRDLELDWPEVDFDIEHERQRLAES